MKKIIVILSILFSFAISAGCQTPKDDGSREQYNDIELICDDETEILPGAFISSVQLEEEEIGTERYWNMIIELNTEGSVLFSDITEKNIGKDLSLNVNGITIMTARIYEAITGGHIKVSGFNQDDLEKIRDALRKSK